MKHSLLKGYIATVMVLAAALATGLGRAYPLTEIGGWLAVLIWTFAVGTQSVAFPRHRVQITASDCFVFYCLVVHGPVGGITAAFVGTLGAMVLGERRLSSQQAAFNLGAVPLCAGLAGYTFELLRGDSNLLVALLAAAAAFSVVNTLVVSVALKLEGTANVRQTLLVPTPGFIISVFVTAVAGGFMARLSEKGPGDWTIAGIVAICFLVGTVLSLLSERSLDVAGPSHAVTRTKGPKPASDPLSL